MAQFHFYNVSVGDGTWIERLNGAERLRRTGQTQGFRSNPIIGKRHGYNEFLQGDIAEVLVYDRMLTANERATVHLNLYRKYNLGLETMTLLPAPGFFTSPVNVGIHSPAADTEIYYTTDGSAPIRNVSPRYIAPFTVTQSTRVRAQGFIGDNFTTIEVSGFYAIGAAPEPVTAFSGLAGRTCCPIHREPHLHVEDQWRRQALV